MDEISPRVAATLDKLGYPRVQWKLRGGSLHAKRGRDHLIIKLSKGSKPLVKAHRDVRVAGLGLKPHKAVYGDIAKELRVEFFKMYKETRSSQC